MGDRIELMLTERDFGIHTAEYDMRTIILTGTVGVEQLVVLRHKLLPPVGVFPNPIMKRIFDCLLFLLGEGRFFGIEHTPFLSVGVCNGVIDPHIPQIQRILQNLVGIGSVRPIGHIGVYIAVGRLGFAGDIPFRRERRIVDFNTSPQIIRRLKGLYHKLLNIGFINPGCSQTNLNFRSVQVFRLC